MNADGYFIMFQHSSNCSQILKKVKLAPASARPLSIYGVKNIVRIVTIFAYYILTRFWLSTVREGSEVVD